MDDFVTVSEAASIKGVAVPTIYAAIREGRLPHSRILGKIGVLRRDLRKWQPVAYAGRPGVKGRGGRPRGTVLTAETKARIAESQKNDGVGSRREHLGAPPKRRKLLLNHPPDDD